MISAVLWVPERHVLDLICQRRCRKVGASEWACENYLTVWFGGSIGALSYVTSLLVPRETTEVMRAFRCVGECFVLRMLQAS